MLGVEVRGSLAQGCRLRFLLQCTITRPGRNVGDIFARTMASSIHSAADVRRLWPADMPLFRDHLLRLDRAAATSASAAACPTISSSATPRLLRQGRPRVRRLLDGRCAAPPNCAPAKRSGPSRRRFSAMSTPRPPSASKSPIAGAASASNCSAASRGRQQSWRRDDRDRLHARQFGMIRLAGKFKAQFTFEENLSPAA